MPDECSEVEFRKGEAGQNKPDREGPVCDCETALGMELLGLTGLH